MYHRNACLLGSEKRAEKPRQIERGRALTESLPYSNSGRSSVGVVFRGGSPAASEEGQIVCCFCWCCSGAGEQGRGDDDEKGWEWEAGTGEHHVVFWEEVRGVEVMTNVALWVR